LEEAKTQKLMDLPLEGDWTIVEDALASMVAECSIGKALFGAAFDKLLRNKASTVVANALQKLLPGPITAALLAENRAWLIEELRKTGHDAMEPEPPRDCEVRYRGALIVMKVASTFDEYTLNVDALVRGADVGNGVIPPILCENLLVLGRAPDAPKVVVDKAMLEANITARQAVVELMQGKVENGDVITTTLEEHRMLLLQLDRSFRLEIAFFASVIGERAERRLLDEVLAVLPTEAAPRTPAQVLSSLDALGRNKLVEFVGLSLQATFRSVVNIVQTISRQQAPALDGSHLSPLMVAIMSRLALWCVSEGQAALGTQNAWSGRLLRKTS
jgi:hypothetical protein